MAPVNERTYPRNLPNCSFLRKARVGDGAEIHRWSDGGIVAHWIIVHQRFLQEKNLSIAPVSACHVPRYNVNTTSIPGKELEDMSAFSIGVERVVHCGRRIGWCANRSVCMRHVIHLSWKYAQPPCVRSILPSTWRVVRMGMTTRSRPCPVLHWHRSSSATVTL